MKVLGFGGFADYYYWSSTEFDFNYAWSQSFVNGGRILVDKNTNAPYVRAIRAF
jgi:hypothetical protein